MSEDFLVYWDLSDLSLECESKEGRIYQGGPVPERNYCALSVDYGSPTKFNCKFLSDKVVELDEVNGDTLKAFLCNAGGDSPVELLPIDPIARGTIDFFKEAMKMRR